MTEVHRTAVVDAGAALGRDVTIGPYSVVGPRVTIGDGTCIHAHVVLDGRLTLGRGCTVFPFACLGTQTQDLKYRGAETRIEIGDGTTLREYVTVNASTDEGEVTRVGARCHIMAYSHVAHACDVGDEVIMANGATLAGHIVIEPQAIVGGLTAIHQFCRVGRLCMIGGCSRITQDCPPFTMVVGNPAAVHGLNTVGLKRRGLDADVRRRLKAAYALVYRQGLPRAEALRAIRARGPLSPEEAHFASFIERSERGITR
ncbi:MAG: acyl-ACP--UDP-N-acetylglucosamine O-acyltransferase [Lentisphaerae bacterium]|nr:acyl-ACP--UDP-N-acetylglucosamine O-acyltransferase [Lentisphaerota bacterium]